MDVAEWDTWILLSLEESFQYLLSSHEDCLSHARDDVNPEAGDTEAFQVQWDEGCDTVTDSATPRTQPHHIHHIRSHVLLCRSVSSQQLAVVESAFGILLLLYFVFVTNNNTEIIAET